MVANTKTGSWQIPKQVEAVVEDLLSFAGFQYMTTFVCYGHFTLQYIILKDGILRFNSFNINSKSGVYFTVHSLGLCPQELFQAKRYIWPYIPSWVLIRTVYHLNSHKANISLISFIVNWSVYSLGSVL